jgi:hypothetical protein
MPGFMPGIHGFLQTDVDGRDKPGHDENIKFRSSIERR